MLLGGVRKIFEFPKRRLNNYTKIFHCTKLIRNSGNYISSESLKLHKHIKANFESFNKNTMQLSTKNKIHVIYSLLNCEN